MADQRGLRKMVVPDPSATVPADFRCNAQRPLFSAADDRKSYNQPAVKVASCTVSYLARNLASASGSGLPLAIRARNSSKYFSCPGGAVISSMRAGDEPELPNACAAPGGTKTKVPGPPCKLHSPQRRSTSPSRT